MPTLSLQNSFDAAVVVPTVLRPSLLKAVRSIFTQDFAGRIQILIGVDTAMGDRGMLETLAAECPVHMHLAVLDPGYSTSVRHGGLHTNQFSGALRTVLTYLANSRHIAYLDDDNWFAPDHLSSLKKAIDGAEWAYSQRWFVDEEADIPLCIDDWESVGPGAGVYLQQFGGFVDPSSLMIDKTACADVAPLWSIGPFADGSGEDRLVFDALRTRYKGAATCLATSFYRLHKRDAMYLERLQAMRERGVVLPHDAGTRALADIAEAFSTETARRRSSDGSHRGPAAIDDILLHDVIRRLKPREIVVIGDAAPALTLIELARLEGLAPLALIVNKSLYVDQIPADLATYLAHPPRHISDPLPWLSSTGLAVDLTYVGAKEADAIDLSLMTAWTITRTGGLILGEGELSTDTPSIRSLCRAVEQIGAKLHSATIGDRARWLIQKDR